jgi:DnaK suppressor protein
VTKTTVKSSDKTPAKAPAKTAKAPAPAPVKTVAKPQAAAKKATVKSTPPKAEAPAKKAVAPKVAAKPAPAAKTTTTPPAAKKVAPPPVAPPPVAQASTKKVESAVPVPKVPQNMTITATKVDSKLANAWKSKAGRDLTEAELQAMPEGEYMNEKQQDFFRGRLELLKEDLLSNAGETTEHLREDTSIVPDPADRATIEEEHALELRTRDRERKLLKKISQALARIESGDYGFCDETGEPIGLGRLLARPTATLSLEAQQRRELKQKMFGD